MRNSVKINLLEIFKTIYEAHEIVKGFIDKKEYDNARNLLADCQDTAIQLGNLIEESEGEGFVTVSFLEEYCEALYEAATNLSDETNGHKVQKQLDKKIIKAENSAKNDIKIKLEVVFMPYKASMWDSLESVWKAAAEDTDCDVYVLPIPYYDRNPDHSFGDFHYEGGEYPNYVPVVHYDTYNLEQRRPDMIFFHYPYDTNNYVTSVDPRFYSSELKKYTDKLVYIPYFVSAEPDLENINTVEHISRYVITPGVLNADKVIVQSEAMRQVYIKVLLGRFGDTPSNRKIVEDKILGLGSPKFEKIANINSGNIVIPEAWQRLITKNDSTQKKIIFYNTSLGALLKYNEQMLEKIKSVLEIFYENRDDVVLWWRPHPLIEATIKSMLPQLWRDYNVIVDRYISEGWGIYDDTPDLNRAIALSDSYYGDPSSVVNLCREVGMPRIIQNVHVKKSNSIQGTNCLSCLYTDVGLFIPSIDTNILFYVDIKGENFFAMSMKIGELTDEADWQIIKLIEYNNKIYMFCKMKYKVWIFDKSSHEMTSYVYIDRVCKHISNVELHNSTAYIFHRNADEFVCYDFENNNVEIIEYEDASKGLLCHSPITKTSSNGKNIFFATRTQSQIFIGNVECENKKVVFKYISELDFVNCIEVANDLVYVLGINSNQKSVLVIYDEMSYKVNEIIDMSDYIHLEYNISLNYFKLFFYNDKLIFIPVSSEREIVVYDLIRGLVQKISCFECLCNKCLFNDVQRAGDFLFINSNIGNTVLKFNMKTLQIERINYSFDINVSKIYEAQLINRINTLDSLCESDNINLERLIKAVSSKKIYQNSNTSNIGEGIFQLMKK